VSAPTVVGVALEDAVDAEPASGTALDSEASSEDEQAPASSETAARTPTRERPRLDPVIRSPANKPTRRFCTVSLPPARLRQSILFQTIGLLRCRPESLHVWLNMQEYWAMRESIDNTVICQYRPRADAVDDLLDLIRQHRATYTGLGLAADRPEEIYVGEDQDGAGPLIVTIFQWIDAEAPGRAHQHPRIAALWEKMETLVEDRAMGPGMAFPHFGVKETL
jgi:hypothetical protein